MNEKEKQTFIQKLREKIRETPKKKKIWFAIGGILALGVVSALGVGICFNDTKNKFPALDRQMFGGMGNGMMTEMVTASGTTSLGYTIDEFEPDYIKSELYIEKVYLSAGDEVEAGTPVFKVSDDNIIDAREELEEKKTETSLEYRAGLITYEKSKINAKYNYDLAMLEGKQAEAVYQSAVKDAEKKLQQARDKVTEAEENIEEYGKAYEQYYYDYNIDDYKERAEQNSEYYYRFLAEYGVEEDSSGEMKEPEKEMEKESEKKPEKEPEKESEKESEKEPEKGPEKEPEEEPEKELEKEPEEEPEKEPVEDVDKKEEEESENISTEQKEEEKEPETVEEVAENTLLLSLFSDSNTMLSRLTANVSLANGYTLVGASSSKQNQEEYLRKMSTLQQMKKNMEISQSNLDKAWSNYTAKAEQADAQLKKLKVQMDSLKADLAEAETTYELEILEAETNYKKALAQSELAKSDYDAALQKAQDELESLEDKKNDAEDNLAEFEAVLGDGYFYTKNSGTVMMLGMRSETNLQGGSMVVAYRNAEDISVTVSVSQDDINKLSVGDKAQVMVENYGTFEGQITYLNPISNSESRTNITYEVVVDLNGKNISSLKENLTATVIFQTGESEE